MADYLLAVVAVGVVEDEEGCVGPAEELAEGRCGAVAEEDAEIGGGGAGPVFEGFLEAVAGTEFLVVGETGRGYDVAEKEDVGFFVAHR